MVAESCPKDEVPTIRRDSLEEQSTYIPEGTMLGGRYRIIRLIGLGGMGEVYLGTQSNMDRRVAIKTLKKEFMSNERLLKRFYREARAAAALDHPNIVKVYDFGLDPDQGCPYIAMEYLEGMSLDALIEQEGKLSEGRTCLIVGAVARALTDAHSKGVVHRDLKPDNVNVQSLTDGTEHVKVLDFGIAKIRRPDGTPTEKLTGTGMALGTPYYMSPEQAMGKPADFRSDLYSLGCIIYQLLAGRLPFDAEQPMAVLLKQLREPAPDLPAMLSDGAPPTDALRNLYLSLMAKNPDQRPDSTLAVADRLQACVRLSRGETLDSSVKPFEFGNETLGPRQSLKSHRVSSAPGLETLVRSSIGEKATLAFGAVYDEEADLEHGQSMESGESQLEMTRSSRLKPMLVAASVLLVGGVAAYFFSAQAPAPTVSAPKVTAQVAAVSAPNPLITPVVEDEVKPKVKTTRVSIVSVPTGATVNNGQQVLGVTPLNVELQTLELPVSMTLRLDGYLKIDASVSAEKPSVSVRLTKKPLDVKPDTTMLSEPGNKQLKTSVTKPIVNAPNSRTRSSRARDRPRRGLKNVRPKLKTGSSGADKSTRKIKPVNRPQPKPSEPGVMETW